jgi:hypothetical protein
MPKIRAKVLRALKAGRMPLEIARKLHIPLLVIAEIVAWEATLRQSSGQVLDL